MNLQCPTRLVLLGQTPDPTALAAVLVDRRIAKVYSTAASLPAAEVIAGCLGAPVGLLHSESTAELSGIADLHRGETVVLLADGAGLGMQPGPGGQFEFEHDGSGWSRVPTPDPNAVTLATYERAADRFRESIRQIPPRESHPLLELAAKAVAPGSTVLELGSCTGDDALLLEAEGYRVRRSDGAAAFVEMMRADGQEADLLNALTDDFGGPYDLVFADAVFLHFDSDQLAIVLRKAAGVARWLVFSLREGDGALWSTRHLDLPRHITLWREPALRDLLTDCGWTVLEVERGETPVGPWMFVLARS